MYVGESKISDTIVNIEFRSNFPQGVKQNCVLFLHRRKVIYYINITVLSYYFIKTILIHFFSTYEMLMF